MFRLVATVKRGSASSLRATWDRYETLEDARAAAAAVLKDERVQRVMIVRETDPKGFVEWMDR